MDQNQELENLRQEFSRAIATLTMNQSAIFQMLQALQNSQRKPLSKYIEDIAGMETARFIIDNMPRVHRFADPYQMLREMCQSIRNLNPSNKLFLEFGVFKGTTINIIAETLDNQMIYGFDSFEGLPEDWRSGYESKAFDLHGNFPTVRENVQLVKGYFDESLPKFLEEHPEPCALIHVDCDLYSSTRTIFQLINERIEPGTVIIFDEFFNYPGWQNGEFRAFNEFVESNQIKFDYIGYTNHEQVAVRIIFRGGGGRTF